MFKHPERVTLNLVMDGEPFDRFEVTKSSWENFLDKLFVLKFPERFSSNVRGETLRKSIHDRSAIPSQL